jgi:hypothetical protein
LSADGRKVALIADGAAAALHGCVQPRIQSRSRADGRRASRARSRAASLGALSRPYLGDDQRVLEHLALGVAAADARQISEYRPRIRAVSYASPRANDAMAA